MTQLGLAQYSKTASKCVQDTNPLLLPCPASVRLCLIRFSHALLLLLFHEVLLPSRARRFSRSASVRWDPLKSLKAIYYSTEAQLQGHQACLTVGDAAALHTRTIAPDSQGTGSVVGNGSACSAAAPRGAAGMPGEWHSSGSEPKLVALLARLQCVIGGGTWWMQASGAERRGWEGRGVGRDRPLLRASGGTRNKQGRKVDVDRAAAPPLEQSMERPCGAAGRLATTRLAQCSCPGG